MEKEMASMSICRKESEDEETTKKKEKVDLFVLLPDEMVVYIFKRLPGLFLLYKAKYVCRRWMDLISNKLLPVRASFIFHKTRNSRARYVVITEEGEEGLQVKALKFNIPDIGIIRSWCNEFLLITNFKEEKRGLYVYNLITKEGSYLPEYCNASCGGSFTNNCRVGISFDVFKGIYKVVHLFPGPPIECHILILTKDIVSSKWKKIQVPNCMYGGWLCYNPVSVQGRYIHWRVSRDSDEKRLISIDMVKEEIVDMSVPVPAHCMDYDIFEMDGSLALFAGVYRDKSKAGIWILKDFQLNKWEKLQSVTLHKWCYRRSPLCGVMSNRYIIVKCHYEGLWYYDLRNGVAERLDINIGLSDDCVVHSSPLPSF